MDGSRPYLVGVLNLTPDSFSDGGRYAPRDAAVARAVAMEREGADIVEVGGESTRPGAEPVSAEEEQRRVLPIVRALAGRLSVPIAIDTYRASTAAAGLDAGAEIVNDISGGQLDGALLREAGRGNATVILGHLRGRPKTMQESIEFGNVFGEVAAELAEHVRAAEAAGIEKVVVDPGIGFGKRTEHNLELIRRAGELARTLGRPVMIGASRKRFLGELARIEEPSARLVPSVVAAVAAAAAGARFLRVHDVSETRQALAVAGALGFVLSGSP